MSRSVLAGLTGSTLLHGALVASLLLLVPRAEPLAPLFVDLTQEERPPGHEGGSTGSARARSHGLGGPRRWWSGRRPAGGSGASISQSRTHGEPTRDTTRAVTPASPVAPAPPLTPAPPVAPPSRQRRHRPRAAPPAAVAPPAHPHRRLARAGGPAPSVSEPKVSAPAATDDGGPAAPSAPSATNGAASPSDAA